VRLLDDTGVDAATMKRLQIMFMSMGEPLLNWKNLQGAMYDLYQKYPTAALLISTSGPKVNYAPLRYTSILVPTIGLQFSVHESTDEARDRLIPFKAKLTLKEIAVEGVKWAKATGREPFFNYCVHDKNNTPNDVERLATLFNPELWQATISVICERDEHVAAANARQRSLAEEFCGGLRSKGFRTRVFDPAGQDDIGGGCGQLWFVQDWMKKHPAKSKPSIGHGKETVHTPKPLPVINP
jgi:23S rRNA (adenine2503-C2)-methyltransferase